MSDARDPWETFLSMHRSAAISARELMLLRTREPIAHRAPSVALYQALMLYHRGVLRQDELESVVDENEELERSIAAKGGRDAILAHAATLRRERAKSTPRPALRLVRPDGKS